MDDDTTPQFDPRFSRAFQRGFDPETPIEESVPEPVDRPTITEATRETAPPVVAPVAPSASLATNEDTRSSGTATDFAVAALLDEVGAESAAAPRAGRNPFLVMLGIVAVVLVAVGIWLFASSGAAFDSRQVRSQGDYMSLDAMIHAAPFIALLGIATVIGVLFVFAARWRRRR